VSLRTSTQENVVIIDTTKGRNAVIGEMDLFSAKMLIYTNAIYIHMGNQFTVKNLDVPNLKCCVEEADTGYYTDSIVKTDIQVLQKDVEKPFRKIHCVVGDILVRMQVTKFKKLRYHTHENIGFGDVNLPPEEMHTRAIMLLFDESTPAYGFFKDLDESLQGIIIARLGYLLKHVAPVFLLCDSNDLGMAERLKDPFFDFPCLYVYDNYPGGTGLSEGILDHLDQILTGAFEVVKSCPCRNGCPACIGPQENDNLRDNLKSDLIAFIQKIL
jgi:DEAD/DEAH box helicase domain-containing protein